MVSFNQTHWANSQKLHQSIALESSMNNAHFLASNCNMDIH